MPHVFQSRITRSIPKGTSFWKVRYLLIVLSLIDVTFTETLSALKKKRMYGAWKKYQLIGPTWHLNAKVGIMFDYSTNTMMTLWYFPFNVLIAMVDSETSCLFQWLHRQLVSQLSVISSNQGPVQKSTRRRRRPLDEPWRDAYLSGYGTHPNKKEDECSGNTWQCVLQE